MGSQTPYRVRWQGSAVRYLEPIPRETRIRSLAQTPNGVIIAGTDFGQVLILTQASAWYTTTDGFMP